MKKTRNKLLSLTLALILTMLPISNLPAGAETAAEPESYEYTIPTELISEENIEQYGHKERFYKAERDMNEIRVLNEDGTVSAYMFDYPVKYIDEDGITKDKSNKLHESTRNNYLYVNDENDIKTYFPKKITKKPVMLEADGFEIEMGIVTDSKYPKKGEVTEDNYVFYDQAFGEDTAIRYQPDFNGYKEEIILKNADAPKSYSFEIKCEGLYIVKENGVMNFISEVNDVLVFKTDPFYIYDSSDDVNEYVDTEYTLTKTDDNEYLLTITLDEDYLNTEGLTYPVYVDPTVQYNAQGNIEDVALYDGIIFPNTAMGSTTYGYIGYKDESYGTGRMLMRFPSLVNNSVFSNSSDEKLVSLELYLYNTAEGERPCTIYIHQFTGSSSWVETTATYNSIGNYQLPSESAWNSLSDTADGYKAFDITNIADDWVGNTTLIQKGIIIKNVLEGEGNEACLKRIQTKDIPISSYHPYLVLSYTAIVSEDNYMIKNAESGLFMDIEAAATAEGAAIQQNVFHTAKHSRWKIDRTYDGFYTIQSLSSGKYIGLASNSTNDAVAIIQLASVSDLAKWTFSVPDAIGARKIIPKIAVNVNKAIIIPDNSTTAGADLIQGTYTTDSNKNDDWILYGLSFGYRHYYGTSLYGYTSVGDDLRSNIYNAEDFVSHVMEKYFDISFSTASNPALLMNYPADLCSDTCACVEDANCESTHHRSTLKCRDMLLTITQRIPEYSLDENEIFVMWNNYSDGYLCDVTSAGHQNVSPTALVYFSSGVPDPIIQVFKIPFLSSTNTDQIEMQKAIISFILLHETIHTLGRRDVAEGEAGYSGNSHAGGTYNCVMKAIDPQNNEAQDFLDFYYSVLGATSNEPANPFCNTCQIKIKETIYAKIVGEELPTYN